MKNNSRDKRWKPLTVSELKAYEGISLYRGVVWKSTFSHYYTTNAIFSTPMVSKVLSYNRLVLIERYIHFVDNNSLGERYKKTAKIAPLHDYLSEKFSVMYTPERDISIDESLLLWKGRLSWKQYIPNKRSRFRSKSFVLCEAKTGYVWKSVLYTGKELTEHLDEKYNGYHCYATKVVLRLVNNLLGKGYRLFIDNYYTSYEITSCLLQNKNR